MSALDTNQNRHIADSLRDIYIRMFETHCRVTEGSEVFPTRAKAETQRAQPTGALIKKRRLNQTLKNTSGWANKPVEFI